MKQTATPVRYSQVFANLDKAIDGARYTASTRDIWWQPGQSAKNLHDVSKDLLEATIAVVNALGDEASQHVGGEYDCDMMESGLDVFSDAWNEILLGIEEHESEAA